MTISICDLEESFSKIMNVLRAKKNTQNIFLLRGQLGAGKTTFVKSYVKELGGDETEVDSPTFSIVNTYKSTGKIIHHFDLYRLESLEEIEDIGFMEYIDSGNTCFIEWPEKIADFLPEEQLVTIKIDVSSNGCRDYTFS